MEGKCKEIAMRRVLRYIFRGLIGVVALVGVLGALFGYFVYSAPPEVPQLSGTLTKGAIAVGELKRSYLTYVPRGLAKGAPPVVVMHGAGENGAQIRIETGYGFERLADEHGFAVVYPIASLTKYSVERLPCVAKFRVECLLSLCRTNLMVESNCYKGHWTC